jgi:hypothetical protein
MSLEAPGTCGETQDRAEIALPPVCLEAICGYVCLPDAGAKLASHGRPGKPLSAQRGNSGDIHGHPRSVGCLCPECAPLMPSVSIS